MNLENYDKDSWLVALTVTALCAVLAVVLVLGGCSKPAQQAPWPPPADALVLPAQVSPTALPAAVTVAT